MILTVFHFLLTVWLFSFSHQTDKGNFLLSPPSEEKISVPDTFYLTKEYNITSNRENATHIRILNNYDEKERSFNVTDYTIDGIKQFEGEVLFLNWGVINGKYKTFYPNGTVHSTGDCITYDDFLLQKHKNFYRNGQLRSEEKIGTEEVSIIQAFDSLGNKTLVNRDGWVELEENGVLWKGKVIREKRDSVWIGIKESTREVLFQETYSSGQLINGITYLNGEKIKYKYASEGINQNALQNLQIKLTKFLKKKLPHSTEEKYYVELIFKQGKAYGYKFLIKKPEEPVPDLSDLPLPVKWLYLVRGIPVDQTSHFFIITF